MPEQKMTVCAIVPFYNEKKTIKLVIETLLQSPLITTVIAVNDGSTDTSLESVREIQNKRLEIIDLQENFGKGYAMVQGILHCDCEIVAFVDGDLTNLTQQHVADFLTPLLSGKADVSVGILDSYDFTGTVLGEFTGERAYFRKDLLTLLKKIEKAGFGTELILMKYFEHKRTVKVPLHKLRGLFKYEKYNSQQTSMEYIKEFSQIGKEMLKYGVRGVDSKQIYEQIVNSLKASFLPKKD